MRVGDAWTFDIDVSSLGQEPPSWNRVSNANEAIRTARQAFIDLGKSRTAILEQTPIGLMGALKQIFMTARNGYNMAQTPLTLPTAAPGQEPVETPAYKEMRNRQVGAMGRAAELMTAVAHAGHNLYEALDMAGKAQFDPALKDMVEFPFGKEALARAQRNMRKGTNHAEYAKSIEAFAFPTQAALTFDQLVGAQLTAKNLMEPYTMRDEITRKLLDNGELLTHEEIKATKDPGRPLGKRVIDAWAKHQRAGRVGPMPVERRVDVGAPKRPALPAPRKMGGFGYLAGPEEEARYKRLIDSVSAAIPTTGVSGRPHLFNVMADASVLMERLDRGLIAAPEFNALMGELEGKFRAGPTAGPGAAQETDWTPYLIAGGAVAALAAIYFLTKK